MLQRLESHECCWTLFLGCCWRHVDYLDSREPGLTELPSESSRRRDLPHVAHACVASVGYERGVTILLDDQGFDYKLAPGAKLRCDFAQVRRDGLVPPLACLPLLCRDLAARARSHDCRSHPTARQSHRGVAFTAPQLRAP